ncbi:hypothetical protein [Methanococcus maripaludis]|uniref:Uncharacterized protein n=1 Tax=Methanococcus maripaludis TaxID=39152 RepID=A0A2L1CBB4_METMI|nr:hypothetical protein [Methanococcus maripaludis]AVB76645.1 hypothetical protein MMJJ_12640 [Methanococcus maripaludis]MBB6496841.1 hypothetical protein [Methanococcus maripaludis]
MMINKKCNVNYLKKQLTIIKGTEKIEIESKIDEIGEKWQKIIEETKTDFEIDLILNLIDIQKEKLVFELFKKEISKKDRELLLNKICEIRKNLESLKK